MRFGLERDELTDPEVYSAEAGKIFSKHWICLGRVEDFDSECASYRTYQIDNFQIVVVRNGETNFRAFHNLCRHRGTQLINSEAGRLSKDVLTCPYHAWTYDLDGRLIGCPNMAGLEEFRRSEFGLKPIGCICWGGFVLVNLSADHEAFALDYGPLMERLENWRLDTLASSAHLSYDVQANWKLLFQNYSECYHCPTVHPSLSRLTPYRSASNDLEQGGMLGGPMQLTGDCETISLDGRRIAPWLPGLNAKQRREVYFYTVFPNWFISPHPDYVLVHRLERRGVRRTKVDCYFLTEQGVEREDLVRAIQQWDEINRQDWEVCELTQRGVDSPAYTPGPYSPLEPMLIAFDEHYRSVMNAKNTTS